MARQAEFSLYLQPAIFSFPPMLPFDIWKCLLRSKRNQQRNPFIFLPGGRSDRFSQQDCHCGLLLQTFQVCSFFRSGFNPDLVLTFYFPTIWSTSFLFFFPLAQSLELTIKAPPIKKKKKIFLGLENLESKVKSERKAEQVKRLARVHQESWQFFWSGQMELAARGPVRWLWRFWAREVLQSTWLLCFVFWVETLKKNWKKAELEWTEVQRGRITLLETSFWCTSVGYYPWLWCAWCIHAQLNNILRKQGRSHRTWLA